MAVSFRGRILTKEQERLVVETIVQSCGIHILCIVDEPKEHEEYYRQILSYALEEKEDQDGQFYRGSLRAGQVLENEGSIVILGDVNPGANVVAKGNVIVLGACRGSVYAGATGDKTCFIAALMMKPVQLRIADKLAKSAAAAKAETAEYEVDPKIAFISDDKIQVKPITSENLNELSI